MDRCRCANIQVAVNDIANRSNGKSMRQRIPVLHRYVVCWLYYYSHSQRLRNCSNWTNGSATVYGYAIGNSGSDCGPATLVV